MEVAAEKLKDASPWKRCHDKLRQCVKKQRYQIANKGPYSQNCSFPSSMYGCDECWTIRNAEHWIIYAFEMWCWRRCLE